MSDKDDTASKIAVGVIIFMFVLCFLMPACDSSSNKSTSTSSSTTSSSVSSSTSNSSSSSSSSGKSSSSDISSYSSNSQRSSSYDDERWPTHSSQLCAVPEANRYYMAYNYIGQNHTVVGPVVRVYQAAQSKGMPIFVSMGVSKMPSDWVTFVIWAEDLDDGLEKMLHDVDHGNAWLEITGTIYLYENQLQIQTGHGYIEYRWWTNVN